jgi:uncharacterized membrane protein YoaK (UPF0700 family)
MPIHYARRLTARSRTPTANAHLGCALAAVAGAVNSIGFGLVHHYTSHMTGMASTLGERVVQGDWRLALASLAAIGAFVCGAACCTLMIRHARQRRLRAAFALPLLVEALLVLAVATCGSDGSISRLWLTVGVLTFAMGLQNALITRISRGEIRTTHVTGIVTDLGIEWAHLLSAGASRVGKTGRAGILAALLACFIGGTVAGTLGVQWWGRLAFLPEALALAIIAIVPAVDDLRQRLVWGDADRPRPSPGDASVD